MFSLKGFAVHSAFVDNTVGVVSKIGEVSPYAKTFSREIGYYTDSATPKIVLMSFLCQNDGVNVTLDVTNAQRTLAILEFVYKETLTHPGEIFADQLLQKLLEKFAGTATDFQSGEIVTDGNYYVPEWLSWRYNDMPDSYIKFWFTDSSFVKKYDEFAIVVVPPLDNLDDFFLRANEVKKKLAARTTSEFIQKTQEAKNGFPESVIRSESYEYRDPANADNRIKTDWNLLIYGDAGNNVDAIKDALVEYILSHSTRPREDWVVIFPDIFRRTEFILTPFFDQYAIPNRLTKAGIYSPFALVPDAVSKIKKYAPLVPPAHINSYSTVFGHSYRGLAVGVISSDENRDGLFNIAQLYPDYIPVSSASQDFNRMTEVTRDWAQAIDTMIFLAESMNQYTDVPRGYSKLVRGGLLYIVRNINNIHYLVTAKKNFPDIGG